MRPMPALPPDLDLDRLETLARALPQEPYTVPPFSCAPMENEIRLGDGRVEVFRWEDTEALLDYLQALDPPTVLALITEVRRLQAALEPVAAWATAILGPREAAADSPVPDGAVVYTVNGVALRAGDLRRVIAAGGPGGKPIPKG